MLKSNVNSWYHIEVVPHTLSAMDCAAKCADFVTIFELHLKTIEK